MSPYSGFLLSPEVRRRNQSEGVSKQDLCRSKSQYYSKMFNVAKEMIPHILSVCVDEHHTQVLH